MRVLIVDSGPLETRAALIEDGAAVEFHLRRNDRPSRLGELWRGRISGVDPHGATAFVDLGPGGRGFLKPRDGGGPLVEGQMVVVEIIRDAAADKAVRLAVRPEPPAPAGIPGERVAGRCLRPAPSPAVGLARPLLARRPDRIVVDGPEAAALRHALGPESERHRGPEPLFTAWGVEDAFVDSLDRVVPLSPHGRLTIDETEALTAIDIDAGGGRPDEVNRVAVRRAAAEIRRRNLSGQIILDPVRLNPAATARLHGVLAQALAADPVGPDLAPGTLEGLMLVTRMRLGPSLRQAATEPQPDGDGRRLSTGHLAARLLRAVETARRAAPGARLRAAVPPDVAAWVRDRPELADIVVESPCVGRRTVTVVAT